MPTLTQVAAVVLGIAAGSNVSGPAAPFGGMQSLVINDATPIDPQLKTGGNTIGASGSGWVATIVLKGLTSLGGTCVPSALTISVSDPGFDTSGNVTTVNRTITGVAQIRRQYPNGATKMISTDGSNLTLLISLDDWIYAGTTIVSATIGGTFYTGCTAGNFGTTYQNKSGVAYTKPLFSWINVQNAYSSGNTYLLEGIPFHRHARAGQQVPCIQYSVTDGSITSTPVLTSAPTVSTKITKGNIPEVWAATPDLSTLATAQIVLGNAKVYPWLGDASAILNLTTDGVAWPSGLPQQLLRIFNDRTGTYGGAFAYVLSGASGGTVSKTAATAQAAPFPTIKAAMDAVKTFNTANGISHNDHGGAEIRLMDAAGSAVTHSVSTAPNADATPGATFCTITLDPAAVGAVKVSYDAQVAYPSMMRYAGNVTHSSQAAISFWFLGPNTSRSQFWLDGITVDGTLGTAPCITWFAMKYLTNVTLTGGRQLTMNNLPDVSAQFCLMAGCVSSNFASCINNSTDFPKVRVGNIMPGHIVKANPSANSDGEHGGICYNNRFLNMIFNNATAATINSGFANVQNLYEHDASDASVICMNFLADADLTSILNYVEMHNTAVGNRCSRLYNDIQATQTLNNGMQKIGISKYNVWDNYNNKVDTFNADGAGAPGSLAYNYSVGNYGNLCLFGAVSRAATDAPHNDNISAPYLGAAWLPSSEYNLFRTALGFTQAQIMAQMVNYTVAPQSVPAAGGNYIPLSTSVNFKNRIPINGNVLLRDLAGTVRRTDGTGAVGCYESQ